MGHAPDTIKRLVDRFAEQRDTIRSPDYNETLIRIDFINPLMHELGWDIDNRQNFAEQYREVVHEDRVKVAGQTKAPDYSFRIGGQRSDCCKRLLFNLAALATRSGSKIGSALGWPHSAAAC